MNNILPQKNTKSGIRGFSLIEVLTALFILGLGLSLAWYFFPAASTLKSRSLLSDTMFQVAQNELEAAFFIPGNLVTDSEYIHEAYGHRFLVRRISLDSTKLEEKSDSLQTYASPPDSLDIEEDVNINNTTMHPTEICMEVSLEQPAETHRVPNIRLCAYKPEYGR